MKLFIDPLAKINIFSMTHRNKKERLSEVLIRLGCESKKSTCRQNQRYLFCYLFYQYIYFIFIFNLRRLIIEEPSKFLIDLLVKINIFFPTIHRNKKERFSEVLSRQGCGSKRGSYKQKQRDLFLLFILFVYLGFERLIRESGNLLIDPLNKNNIFFYN